MVVLDVDGKRAKGSLLPLICCIMPRMSYRRERGKESKREKKRKVSPGEGKEKKRARRDNDRDVMIR